MDATTLKQFPFPQMIDLVKEELNQRNIEHHLSWITIPEPPPIQHAYFGGGDLGDLLRFIEDVYPVVCLTTSRQGILYLSFMADKNWLESLES